MVVLIRELADTLYFIFFKLLNNLQELSKQYLIDMETDFTRGHSVSLSSNNFREASITSAGFLVDYVECIKA